MKVDTTDPDDRMGRLSVLLAPSSGVGGY